MFYSQVSVKSSEAPKGREIWSFNEENGRNAHTCGRDGLVS